MENDRIDPLHVDAAGEPRPLGRRLVHVAAEIALSFLLAGGVFLESFHLLCLGHNNCSSFGGIAYAIASLFLASFLWATYLGLCRRFRMQLATRRNIDIAVAILTAALWIAILVRE
jgi:hypothetical protein